MTWLGNLIKGALFVALLTLTASDFTPLLASMGF